MRNLVVCCDGTWNTEDQNHGGVPTPTNVVRLERCLAARTSTNIEQVKYYHTGVGSEGDLVRKVLGGGLGLGLDRNIMSAYHWLCSNYQPGDRTFLFGFSRGAYTVRCLAGMVAHSGLLDLSSAQSTSEAYSWVQRHYDHVRKRDTHGLDGLQFLKDDRGKTFRETWFLGVWDTVGALGIPDDLFLLNLLENPKRWRFPDAELSDHVKNARHALALDEMRGSFTPTLWENVEGKPNVKQVWFVGCHSDVGGGFVEAGLSDIALMWMMDEARDLGLGFQDDVIAQIKPDPFGLIHNSLDGVWAALKSQPRRIPDLLDPVNHESIHPSVETRRNRPSILQGSYRPLEALAPGQSHRVPIYASKKWNPTGLYLHQGRNYRFQASGEWVDESHVCGPEGICSTSPLLAHLAYAAGGFVDELEGLLRQFRATQAAELRYSRRNNDFPWFSLVGVIASGGNPALDGTVQPHETFLIGDGREFTPKESGYLYCYANDTPATYGNNRGSVDLVVECLAVPAPVARVPEHATGVKQG